jgi:hypothetical protein
LLHAPQVLRLLEGLLGVCGRGLITAEVAMSGGRSDLVISDLQGRSLLVVEYKQRHSGQASACQQQDMGQVRLDRWGGGGVCEQPASEQPE